MRKDAKCYYARFTELHRKKFRFETLIYLEDLREELNEPVGQCVAAVVCKNPGSASEAYETAPGVWAPIRKDNTLTTVRKIFIDACGSNVPSGAFVKVWNLFYLCDPDPGPALKFINKIGPQNSPPCPSESGSHDIVWFAWGRRDPESDSYKKRFREMSIRRPFFFDKNEREIIERVPSGSDFAKHPIKDSNVPPGGKTVGEAVKDHLRSVFARTGS